MSRKILFRGFHPDEPYFTLVGKDTITLDGEVIHGEWVKGYLRNATTIDEYKEIEIDGVKVEVFVRSCRILPETVGQWVTTDKNGKDVFEGDKIKAHYVNTAKGKETHIQIVVYKGMAFMAKAEDIGFYSQLYDGVPHFPFDKSVYMDEFEVIGNKWEVRG